MAVPSTSYALWQETLEYLSRSDGTVLLLGASDTGKTTFARLLLNRWAVMGRTSAFLDADIGQSEVGPPGTIGMAYVTKPLETFAALVPEGLAFVGTTMPMGNLLEIVTGVKRLAERAQGHPQVVDTGGFIQGAGAQRLAVALAVLLQPAHIVGLQRAGELEPILRLLRGAHWEVHTPGVPEEIGRKTPFFRAQRRSLRFAAYFYEATLQTYSFRKVPLLGTWLGCGTPLPAHLLRFVRSTLETETRVFYAETFAGRLCLMTDKVLPPHSPGISVIQRQLRVGGVVMTRAPRLKHLLIGLEEAEGQLLGMGLLEAIDFRRGELGILSPVKVPSAVERIRFGRFRVTPEGKELGLLRGEEI
ncbi:Clp1/GlmU family protein [Chthonomonas calidirosea]|uniref:Clp1/GlmU family protein n=1 Tax=Chthonomonas calidirosea TaxID=454171 RepID=UPI0006ECCB4E|nr:Clp1/GlmU family protein [Chthonomonas calidirosea]CEK18544.1 predicted GTPase or GTP-binding protein [Chthonomonas calidirosea]